MNCDICVGVYGTYYFLKRRKDTKQLTRYGTKQIDAKQPDRTTVLSLKKHCPCLAAKQSLPPTTCPKQSLLRYLPLPTIVHKSSAAVEGSNAT